MMMVMVVGVLMMMMVMMAPPHTHPRAGGGDDDDDNDDGGMDAMQVMVLHGGLFSQSGVLLEEIMEANRKDYNLSDESRKHKGAAKRSPKANPDDMVGARGRRMTR
jgi:hypothetical protein